uniref:Uncharacterized protein n=1 Tax=Bracon brevicornis TaxID=1563983 RepID=A0A6V7IJ20_9HYME
MENNDEGRRNLYPGFTQLLNRYDKKSKGPYIVFITFGVPEVNIDKKPKKEMNLGNLHPMAVGKRLRKNDFHIERIKRIGANLTQVSFKNYEKGK